jgi:hypothetical protein
LGFPTSIAGTLELDALACGSVDVLASRVEQALINAGVSSVERVGGTVIAKLRFFDLRVLSFDALAFVDSGEVEVVAGDPVTLRYEFPCLGTLILMSALAAVLGVAVVVVALMIGFITLIGLALAIPAIVWLVMFGLNYFMAAGVIADLLGDIGS